MHKGERISFDFWSRPLWDWALDLVKDPILAPQFEWDAQQLSIYNGTTFERFVHEPWTADRWWEIQVKKFCLKLYSSLHFLHRGSPFASFFMLTKQNYPHLVPRWGTL